MTAISVPDALHESIETFIQVTRMTRSEFYQRAARAYMEEGYARAIAANLDRVYGGEETAGGDLLPPCGPVPLYLQLGQAFGNVTLRMGEAGLPKRSVVNISQIATVDRSMLDGRVGR